jgi:hypothetical protein
MLSQTEIFARIENTKTAKTLLFASARTTSDMISDTTIRKPVIQRSTPGSPKNNICFFAYPAEQLIFAEFALN